MCGFAPTGILQFGEYPAAVPFVQKETRLQSSQTPWMAAYPSTARMLGNRPKSASGLLRAFMLKTRRGYPARLQAQDKASKCWGSQETLLRSVPTSGISCAAAFRRRGRAYRRSHRSKIKAQRLRCQGRAARNALSDRAPCSRAPPR